MRVKSKSAVLHMLLGSPNYISGQELANRLGVSRQTVSSWATTIWLRQRCLPLGCIARWSPFIMLRWTPPTRRPSGC